MSYQRIDMPMLHVDVTRRHQSVWRDVVGQDPSVSTKKAVAYHNWFALPMKPDTDPQVPYSMPLYLKLALSRRVMRNVSRFRLRGHKLRCETASFKGSDKNMQTCNRCVRGEIQDEKHVVFNCAWDAIIQLRHEYSHIFVNNSSDNLISFTHQHHVDTYKCIHQLQI
jgi:hypothetical protein